jgi:hypothetical protein
MESKPLVGATNAPQQRVDVELQKYRTCDGSGSGQSDKRPRTTRYRESRCRLGKILQVRRIPSGRGMDRGADTESRSRPGLCQRVTVAVPDPGRRVEVTAIATPRKTEAPRSWHTAQSRLASCRAVRGMRPDPARQKLRFA